MRQHSATLSITLITLLLAACSQDGGTPQSNQPTPNPSAPAATPTKAQFDKPLVPEKKDKPPTTEVKKPTTPDAKNGNSNAVTTPKNGNGNAGKPQDILKSTDPELRIISIAKGRKDPFGSISVQPNLTPLPPDQKFAPNVRPLPTFPKIPDFTGLDKGNLNPIPPLPSFPQLPDFRPKPNLITDGNSPVGIGKTVVGQGNPPGKTTPVGTVKNPPKLVTKPTVKKPFSLAKPSQPLILPSNDQIPVFKPELPKLPEPTLAQGVEVNGLISVGNQSYAIVKAPNEPYSRRVQVGERLSNGEVLVKRIDVNNRFVVLEQYGVEVNKNLKEATSTKQV